MQEDDGDVVLNVLGCRADVLGTREEDQRVTAQELCEQGDGPGLALILLPHSSPVPNRLYGFCGCKAQLKKKKKKKEGSVVTLVVRGTPLVTVACLFYMVNGCGLGSLWNLVSDK